MSKTLGEGDEGRKMRLSKLSKWETVQERATGKKPKNPMELEENQPCNERLKILDLFSSSKRRLRFN